jgi:2-desacetyl-2-hydroxyethyl bacteriochlorophyllide A dehydrogenase
MSTSISTNARRLVFPEKQKVLIESFDPGAPAPGEVRVRTAVSLMSTGTENIVFNRLFDPGTHWDRWVKYPFYPGYSSVGTIDQVGEGVEPLKIGDRVGFRLGHRSHAIVPADACYPIPENVPFEHAVWFALAKIAFVGAKAADYRLGDSCLIIGAGPIGQMSLRWAAAAGVADIIVVDTAAHRMPLAKAGGATATIVESIDAAREDLLKARNGQLPRVVIDSTGNAAVFASALALAADRGTVVVLGDTGQPARQYLTSDVITRGLTIVGAHDAHNTAQWNDTTISRLFFSLAASGRISLDSLTSHRYKPQQCAEAYATANHARSTTMGILFDWSDD